MLVNDILSSEIHAKITLFFHENQASIDTPRGVATWIHDDRAKVKRALEDLADLKILVAHRATSTTGYSYTRNVAMISRIGRLLKKRKT